MAFSILFLVAVYVVSALPLAQLLERSIRYVRSVNDRLDHSESWISFTPVPLVIFLTWGVHFGKPIGAMLASDYFFGTPQMQLATLAACLVGHGWSVFLKFKPQNCLYLVVWGLYSTFHLPLAIIFPICWAILVLLTNSLQIGLLATIVVMLAVFWLNVLPVIFLSANLTIFMICVVLFLPQILQYFDSNRETLYRRFTTR